MEESSPAAATSPQRTSLRLIVLVALVLRLAVIFIGHTYRINPRNDYQSFGFEMGRVARSIAEGHGFGSPFDLPTGPTALVPPLYPYLLAGLFKIFGVYSRGSAIAILAVDSVFSALLCPVIYFIGLRVFGHAGEGARASGESAEAQGRPGEGAGAHAIQSGDDSIARWSAWTWAVFPYAIYWPVRMIWETSLSVLLMSLAVLLTLHCDAERRTCDWVYMGLVWGAMALTNPALLLAAPVSLIWIGARRNLRIGPAAAAVLICAAMMAPWTVRNYRVFHRLMLVRDNFWLEVWVNNNPRSNGMWTRTEHPGNNPEAMQHFQQLGELGYMNMDRAKARYFIESFPAVFVGWSFKRVFYFWLGEPKETLIGGVEFDWAKHIGFGIWTALAIGGLWLLERRHNFAAGLLAGLLLLYPIPYYITRASPRYRHPIEPLLVLLTVYLVAKAVHAWRTLHVETA